jgi:HPt (histidine-containing phosphotransfer) domain-containing protein
MAILPHLDDAVLATLIDVMEDEYPVLLETYLVDSDERVAMLEAVQGDLDTLRRAAHSFKGSCSNMGALQLADMCRQLEDACRQGQSDKASELIEQIRREYAVVKILVKAALQRYRF